MDNTRCVLSMYCVGYVVCLMCMMFRGSQQAVLNSELFSAFTQGPAPRGRSIRLQMHNTEQGNPAVDLVQQLVLLHEYIAEINSLTKPKLRAFHMVEKKQENGDAFLRQSRTVISSMALVHSRYEAFYRDLSIFATALSSHLNATAPAGLSNVLVLKYVLQPGDHAFAALDERLVTQKFYLIHDVLEATLQRVPPYLAPASRQWFDDQQFTLEFDMFMLKGPILDLQSHPPHHVSAVDGGAGGINKPVQNSMGPDVLTKLQELITTLQGMPTASKSKYPV